MSMGLPCPMGMSIAEHMLLAVGDPSHTQDIAAKASDGVVLNRPPLATPSQPDVDARSATVNVMDELRVKVCSLLQNSGVLAWSCLVGLFRDPSFLLMHLLGAMAMGLLVGFTFFNVPPDNTAGELNWAQVFFTMGLTRDYPARCDWPLGHFVLFREHRGFSMPQRHGASHPGAEGCGARDRSRLLQVIQTNVGVNTLIHPRESCFARSPGRPHLKPTTSNSFSASTYMIIRLTVDGIFLRAVPAAIYGTLYYWIVGLRRTASAFTIFLGVLTSFTALVSPEGEHA